MFAQQYVEDQELPTEMVSVVAHSIHEQIRESLLKLERGSDAVCVHAYVCVRVCVRACVCVRARMRTCARARVCVGVCVYVCVCVCTRAHVCV